jgi:hypothetical protein
VPAVASISASLLFVNVYGKVLLQVGQEVIWFSLILSPKAWLSPLYEKMGLDLYLVPVAPFNALHTALTSSLTNSFVFLFWLLFC